MRTVGLFGGSFNPPHVAHQLVGMYALETQAIDELWFVPVFAHPFHKILAPYADRVAMCELAVAALGPRARVSRAEQELAARPGFITSHTIDLVDYLISARPDAEFRLIVGGDILGQTASWHRWDELAARAPLIVIGRAGHAVPPGSHVTEVVMPEISATAVRALLARSSTAVGSLLPRAVLRYIADHDLYKASP